jgi:hypothetical protein
MKMRLDIYRRAEHNGIFSYLAVPEGKPIPQEATNTDWLPAAQSLEVGDDVQLLPNYHIDMLTQQMGSKGYAITGLKDM